MKSVKIGHAGTLDPLATGVLVVCVGKATKRIESEMAGSKGYRARLKLGFTTPSYDAETPEEAFSGAVFPSSIAFLAIGFHFSASKVKCLVMSFEL